jgi:hypothetical protein
MVVILRENADSLSPKFLLTTSYHQVLKSEASTESRRMLAPYVFLNLQLGRPPLHLDDVVTV